MCSKCRRHCAGGIAFAAAHDAASGIPACDLTSRNPPAEKTRPADPTTDDPGTTNAGRTAAESAESAHCSG